jgi:hypothetical protein
LTTTSQYLKQGITLKKLEEFANEMTDYEAAEQMNSARDKLFNQPHELIKIQA